MSKSMLQDKGKILMITAGWTICTSCTCACNWAATDRGKHCWHVYVMSCNTLAAAFMLAYLILDATNVAQSSGDAGAVAAAQGNR